MSLEISGGLIQMTAHMEVTAEARALITSGVILAAVFAFLAICAAISRRREHRRRYVLAFAAFALLGVGLAAVGANAPREKVLQCCVSGPISLESVAARYDIRKVDGKLLVLVER